MDKYPVKYCLFLLCLFLLALPFVVWVSVLNETEEQECCTGEMPMTKSVPPELRKLAHGLRMLEREFNERLNNWEFDLVNKETTNGYRTRILQELIEKFVDVEAILSVRSRENSEEIATSNDISGNIERTIEEFEKHIGRLQTLDSLLMIKLERKYSHGGLQESLPWLRFTRPPPGKTWRSLQAKRSIFFHMVFFSNYNSKPLHRCLASVTASAVSSFLERSVQCLFVLGKPREKPRRENVKKTLEVIKHVRFCKKIIWKIDLENVLVNGSLSTWWFIMESIFEQRSAQGTTKVNGFFHEYKGDILFFEEDVVLSEDVLEVAWFASFVKNTLTNIQQFALGGEAGENMVNGHPDTFVVRKAVTFLRNAYGFNVTTWKILSLLKEQSWYHEEWNIALGKMIVERNDMKAFHVVIPTVARYHLSVKNEKLPWSLATRTIDMNSANVNSGIRDVCGYLCEPSVLVPVEDVREVECPCVRRKWDMKRSKGLYCAIQPFHVQDKCFSGKYLDLN